MAAFSIDLGRSSIMFRKLNSFQKVKRQKKKGFLDNHLHNYLEFYKVLVHVSFAAIKKEFDIYYRKPYMRIASRAANQLKT